MTKLFSTLDEKPLTELDANILKGIVRKKFKEDNVDDIDFWDIDPDNQGWIKWSKAKTENWWKSTIWALDELEDLEKSME